MGFEDIVGLILTIVLGGGLLVLIVLGLILKAKSEAKKRRWRVERPVQDQALPALANQRRWTYAPRDDRTLRIIDVLRRGKGERPIQPTDRSRGPKGLGASGRAAFGFRFMMNPTSAAEHVMSFQDEGRQYVVFQQRWNDHKTRSRATAESEWYWEEDRDIAYYASTFAMRLPKSTPYVCVTKRWKGAVSGLVGIDTTLEHHRFNREYLAFAEHPRFGHDLLHQGLMDWVMFRQPEEDVFLTVADGWCFVTAEDVLRAEEVDERLTVLKEFAGLIPEHVWNVDYGLNEPGSPPVLPASPIPTICARLLP